MPPSYVERLAAAAAYRPQRVVRAAVEGRPLSQWAEQLEAAVLFADISGFTRLSEELAKLGTRGAEEMTAALNRTFEAAIGAVHLHGGEVLAFGGDALTAIFAAGSADRLGWAVQRARACAEAVHAGVDALGEISGVRLRIAIGLGSGKLALLAVESGSGEAELLAAGPALEEAAVARGTAKPGESVEGPQASAFPRMPAYMAMAPPPLPSTLDEAGARRAWQALEPLLFHIVRERIDAGAASGAGEHRRVVCLFANVRGLDAVNAPDTARRFLSRTLAAVDRAGGLVNKFESADKGLLLLALFGAQQGTENDEERACAVALSLLDEAATARKEFLGVGIRVGVNAGHVFAGDVGAGSRKEFTVIGDTVNLAARLMSNAPWGKVYVGGRSSARLQSRFRLVRLPDLPVKGRAEPAQVHELLGEAQRAAWRSARGAGVFVGRGGELARVDGLLGAAADGRGCVLWITGEAGVGKTRLAREVAARAASRGFEIAAGECAFDRSQVPYLPFRSVIRSLLALPAQGGADALAAKLGELVPGAGLELAACVAGMLGLQRGGAERAAGELHGAMRKLVAAAAARKPRLLMLDELQWVDDLSRKLLGELCADIGGWRVLVLALGRTDARPPVQDPALVELVLDRLGSDDARQLATARLGAASSPEGVGRIDAQSGGNPYFIEELARAVLEAAQRGERADGALPQTLQALVQARLDRLDPLDRELLRTAAALGRTVDRQLLGEVAPPGCTEARLGEGLATLEEAELLVPAGELLEFPQALLREVAYEGLAYTRRRHLHCEIGEALERRLGDNALLEAELLAHHFRLGEDLRELPYADAAAAKCERLALHGQAAGQLERVLALLPAEERERRRAALARLSAALCSQGQYTEAIAAADRITALPEGGPAVQAEAAVLRARARLFKGETQPAFEEARGAARLAGEAKLPVLGARAGHLLALCYWNFGDFRSADVTLRGIAPAVRSSGDRSWRVEVLNHLIYIAWVQGAPEAEDRLLEEQRVLSEGFAGRGERIRSLGMRSFVALRRGDLAAAELLGGEYLREADASDESYVQAWVKLFFAMLAQAKGNLAAASEGFRTASVAFHELGSRYDEGVSRALLADADADRGRLASALAQVEATTRLCAKTGDRFGQALAHLARARVALIAGGPPAAERAAREALSMAAQGGIGQVELAAAALLAAARGDLAAARTARMDAERRRWARAIDEALLLEAEAALAARNPGAAHQAALAARRSVRSGPHRARAGALEGRAVLLEERPFEAAPLLARAATELEEAGLHLEAALAAAQAARARGQRDPAAETSIAAAATGLPDDLAAALRARADAVG